MEKRKETKNKKKLNEVFLDMEGEENRQPKGYDGGKDFKKSPVRTGKIIIACMHQKNVKW